jgi:hypothetical protein
LEREREMNRVAVVGIDEGGLFNSLCMHAAAAAAATAGYLAARPPTLEIFPSWPMRQQQQLHSVNGRASHDHSFIVFFFPSLSLSLSLCSSLNPRKEIETTLLPLLFLALGSHHHEQREKERERLRDDSEHINLMLTDRSLLSLAASING